MASGKRDLLFGDALERKKARFAGSEPSQAVADRNLRVVLNPADCDIDFNIRGDGLQGSALYEGDFAYCWSGARANIGISSGKYCFGCKIVSAQLVDMKDTPSYRQHRCRIGISRGDEDVGSLGETLNSFGYEGCWILNDSDIFSVYGENFGVGDTIVCAVDLKNNLENRLMASIGFSKNGKWFGVAEHFEAGPSGLGVADSALFPHILLKNVAVQMQFSVNEGLIPQEGYKPWDAAISDGHSVGGPTFSNVNDCEVIMMVGLPCSGKTTWAERWAKEHPEKRYVLLGTNLVLEQMKANELWREHNYRERFDCSMNKATKIVNTLVSRASKIPRNFIIDHTNVCKSVRRRKLEAFPDRIKIAVVVFPRAEVLKSRADRRFKATGKEVSAEAVNELLAKYTLPTSNDMPGTDEYFDKVLFVELSREESQRSLDEMKKDYQKASLIQSFQNQGN